MERLSTHWKTMQKKISWLFYQHGLFCASHPLAIITTVILIVLFMSLPLFNIPLHGTSSPALQFHTSMENYKIPYNRSTRIGSPDFSNDSENNNIQQPPRWYFGAPVLYIQQVVVKAAILPWQGYRLIPSDPYRATLSAVFDLLEHIDSYQLDSDKTGAKSVVDLCLRVSEVTTASKLTVVMPEYNCLIISPARFWKQSKQEFLADGDIVNTIFKKYAFEREILFGVPNMVSGIKKYYYRNRQRVITFAVTIAYRKYNRQFIDGLRDHLQRIYPLSVMSNCSHLHSLVHIHYQSQDYIVQYTPLIFAYIILCLYIFFSVRKIEMVKSKWGLALSAMATVVASLIMSVSLCVFFGLTPSLSGSEIFPYLVVLIGMENVLVVTKSVASTPVHLEVKFRVAQGMQKEGWYIFKNLITELLILAFGFFTFVPAIQEFCLFAVLGLGSDCFLQMFFFTPVLSIDIRRMELSDLTRRDVQEAIRRDAADLANNTATRCPVMSRLYATSVNDSAEVMTRFYSPVIKSAQLTNPALVANHLGSLDDPDDDDPLYMGLRDTGEVQKKIKLLHFWERNRILQRAIMICVIIWILLLVYKTSLIEDASATAAGHSEHHPSHEDHQRHHSAHSLQQALSHDGSPTSTKRYQDDLVGDGANEDEDAEAKKLLHDDVEQWLRLPHSHWRTLLSAYNISLEGRYMTIIPSIHLSIALNPDVAISLRHPAEIKSASYLLQQQQAWNQSIATRPVITNHSSPLDIVIQKLMRYPRTRTESLITVLLCLASFVLLLFLLLALYKCACSRNYAKWRMSWLRDRQRRSRNSAQYYKQIRESIPLVLNGHVQEVECIVNAGPIIVSSCLGGTIRIWDVGSGECLQTIDRLKYQRVRNTRSDRLSQPTMPSSPSVFLPPSLEQRKKSKSQYSLATSYDIEHDDDDEMVVKRRSKKHHSRHRSVDCALASLIPDLTETIDTDFRNVSRHSSSDDKHTVTSPDISTCSNTQEKTISGGNGYDFTQFKSFFEEHKKIKQDEQLYLLRKRGLRQENGHNLRKSAISSDSAYLQRPSLGDEVVSLLQRRVSTDDSSAPLSEPVASASYVPTPSSAVWCLAVQQQIIVAGCGNGAIEFWDEVSGQLQCLYQRSKAGVTAICFNGSRIISARVDGLLDFMQYFTANSSSGFSPFLQSPLNDLAGSSFTYPCTSSKSENSLTRCILLNTIHAHHQPINLIQSRDNFLVTASLDHTLKIYRVDTPLCLFTLHGHTGSVTSLCLDSSSLTSASGSADASVRLWDVETGLCLHKLTGHASTVTSVICTPSRVASVAMDDRLCIWDRSKGHLIRCIQMEAGCCNTVAMMTRHLILTGGQGCLHLWDVQKGVLLRVTPLGDQDISVFVRQLVVIDTSVVVCGYGQQLRLIRFTSVLEKDE